MKLGVLFLSPGDEGFSIVSEWGSIEATFYGSLSFNTSLAAPGPIAYCLKRRTACNMSPPTQSKVADLVWFGHSRQFSLKKFFDPSTPSTRKGRNGKKMEKNGMEKNDIYDTNRLERRTIVPK